MRLNRKIFGFGSKPKPEAPKINYENDLGPAPSVAIDVSPIQSIAQDIETFGRQLYDVLSPAYDLEERYDNTDDPAEVQRIIDALPPVRAAAEKFVSTASALHDRLSEVHSALETRLEEVREALATRIEDFDGVNIDSASELLDKIERLAENAQAWLNSPEDGKRAGAVARKSASGAHKIYR